jgi:hypothetical protein
MTCTYVCMSTWSFYRDSQLYRQRMEGAKNVIIGMTWQDHLIEARQSILKVHIIRNIIRRLQRLQLGSAQDLIQGKCIQMGVQIIHPV